ncbi:MAG: hypothetical protein WEF50_06665 [Myxococcota bacterium]
MATVADPLDSHTPHLFDDQIDALMRAAGALGYSFKSHALPWSRASSDKAPPGLAASPKSEKECWAGRLAGVSKAETAEVCRKERNAIGHRLNPGALLFVRSPEDKAGRSTEELLLVLLVGETPTTGAHPKALASAVRTWKSLSPSAPSVGGDGRLMVIGPTFSGSASGLVASSATYLGPGGDGKQRRVDFFTGSATANNLTALAAGDCSSNTNTAALALCVHQITHTDDQLQRSLCDYLKSRAFPGDRFALLSESATEYGGWRPKEEEPEKTSCNHPLIARFPLHISQLRAASETADGRSERDALSSPIARRALELSSDEFGAPIDVPASQAPAASAIVTDLELADTLAGLRERGVGWAVLLASDVRDKVFLAELVRRNVPEIQLSTLESDIFLTHPRFTRPLLGMVVASSYPVSARIAVESVEAATSTDSRLPPRVNAAASSLAEGMATAAVLAFQGIVSSTECVSTVKTRSDGDATARACTWLETEPPAVWISVIGRDGLWPLSVQAPTTNAAAARGRVSIAGRPSVAFSSLLLLLSVIGMHHSLRYFRAVGGIDGQTRFHGLCWLLRRAASSDGKPAESLRLRLMRPTYLALLPFALAFLTAMPLVLVSTSSDQRRSITSWIATVALLSLALGPLPAFFDALISAFRPSPVAGAKPATGALYRKRLLLSVLVVVAAITVVAWTAVSTDSVNWSLYAHRTSHLNGGVSSAMPILFLSGALWLFALALASRAELAAGPVAVMPFEEPLPGAAQGPFSILDELSSRLLKETAPLAFPTGTWLGSAVVVVVLAGVPGIAFFFQLRLPLDGFGTWLAFYAGSLLLLFAIVGSGVRLFRIWRRVRELLRELPQSLVHAFRRLPERFASTIGFEPQGHGVGPAELQYSGQQALLLAAEPTPLVLRDAFTRRLGVLVAGSEVEKRRALASAARDLLPVLDALWANPGNAAPAADVEVAKLLRAIEEKANVLPLDAVSLLDSHLLSPSRTLSIRMAEEFVAGQIVFFVSYLFVHLRTLILSCSFGLILLLLAVTSYPFQPQAPTVNFVMALFAIAIAAAVVAIVQASRNEVLSLIENTKPNAVAWNATTLTQILTYVALPALAALSSQLPALGHLFSTLFDAFTTR